MLLSELFKGAPQLDIKQLSVDSRVPMKDAIFFCLDGIKYDGHDYIDEAIKNGAKVIVYSKELVKKPKAILIKVPDVKLAMKQTANTFYNNPNEGIDKYLVTGNYGRASVASFINFYLNQISTCGYVGILGIKYGKFSLKSSFPTLNGLDNLKVLNTLKKNRIESCTFEASASAMNLGKLETISPDFFIYTCTNKESSEYHSLDYINTLRKYLYSLEAKTKIIYNIDDFTFNEVKDCFTNPTTYGTSTIANYQIRDVSLSSKGISYKIVHDDKAYPVSSKLQGLANVYNLTAAIVALCVKGHNINDVIQVFKNAPEVDGVLERIDDTYNVIVDCAFDLNSIEELFKYAKNAKGKNKAIGVLGIDYTDGDKRIEKIIQLCEQYLDVIILTENESLQGEVMSILQRCDKYITSSRVMYCSTRYLAIENAIEIMNSNDILLIVGKGNEQFLNKGLGKEFYNGDKFYGKRYLEKRRREENAII